MDLVNAGLLLMVLFLNWRDIRAGRAEHRQWTVTEVTRRRAAVLIIVPLLLWAVTALAILIELSDRRPNWGVFLLIPTIFGLQVCLFRRTELFQFRARTEPLSGPQEELGV